MLKLWQLLSWIILEPPIVDTLFLAHIHQLGHIVQHVEQQWRRLRLIRIIPVNRHVQINIDNSISAQLLLKLLHPLSTAHKTFSKFNALKPLLKS